MLTVIFGVMAAALGILVCMIRVIGVLNDEVQQVDTHAESRLRYRWLYRISEKLETVWPLVKPLNESVWAEKVANGSIVAVAGLLVFAGLFEQFLKDHAVFFLIAIFIFMSLSNGPRGLEVYRRLKPYLPVIFPAIAYHGMTMLENGHPEIVQKLVFPGRDFEETKLLAALVGLAMAFIIPYPLAKFDFWFSKLISASTLYFVKDFLRLGVKPSGALEISLKKVAKDSIMLTTKVALVILGALTFMAQFL